MHDVLRPCPFCGSREEVKPLKTDNEMRYIIECQSCFGSTGIHADPQRAIDTWNRRVADWVSVEDRLPGETKWVLAYADEAIDCVGYEPDNGFSHWHPNRGSNVRVEDITHWRPLTNPPPLPTPPHSP